LSMGSLPPDDYTAVFAYLLQRNGMPAGARRFDASDSVLRLIRFDRLATTRTPDPLPAPEFIEGERPRPLDAGPSQGELTSPDPADWLYHTGNLSGTRYSKLAQLTPANVARLAVACVFQAGSSETFQTGPLVYRGVMYLTTVRATVAIDAATCRPRWRHTWQPQDYELWPLNTVPRPGEPGAETWANPAGIPQGGGAVWTPLALDPAKGELYAAVTNPAPDLAGRLRPGTNLYTNALVALDQRAGTLRWYD